jgi:hypothetical protein
LILCESQADVAAPTTSTRSLAMSLQAPAWCCGRWAALRNTGLSPARRRKRGPRRGVQYRCDTYAASPRGLRQPVASPAAAVALARANAQAASPVPAARPAPLLARDCASEQRDRIQTKAQAAEASGVQREAPAGQTGATSTGADVPLSAPSRGVAAAIQMPARSTKQVSGTGGLILPLVLRSGTMGVAAASRSRAGVG